MTVISMSGIRLHALFKLTARDRLPRRYGAYYIASWILAREAMMAFERGMRAARR